MSFKENKINSCSEFEPDFRNLSSQQKINQFKTNNTKSDSLNTSIQKYYYIGEEIYDDSFLNCQNDIFDEEDIQNSYSLSSKFCPINNRDNYNEFDILGLNIYNDFSSYENNIKNFENNEISKEKSETNEEKINKDESNKKCKIFFTFIKKGRKTKD